MLMAVGVGERVPRNRACAVADPLTNGVPIREQPHVAATVTFPFTVTARGLKRGTG